MARTMETGLRWMCRVAAAGFLAAPADRGRIRWSPERPEACALRKAMIYYRKGYGGFFILFRVVGTSWPFGVPGSG
eukprot:Skav231479  [mRNA]  locus=scaffold1100:632431:634569:- [translate_table: standard]